MLRVLLSEAEDSLKKIRFSLRESLPEVPAAKLAEALAAGLGFRNNAALLTSLRSQSSTVDLVTDPEAFLARITALGHPIEDDVSFDSLSKALRTVWPTYLMKRPLPLHMKINEAIRNLGFPLPKDLSDQVLMVRNKRGGPTVYPDFGPDWSMFKAFMAIIDMLGEDRCRTYRDFIFDAVENPKENHTSFAIAKTQMHGYCNVAIPQLMEGNKISASKIMEFRRLAFDLSGYQLGEYSLDKYIVAGPTYLIVDKHRVALPKDMRALQIQFRKNGLSMRGIYNFKMPGLSEVFA